MMTQVVPLNLSDDILNQFHAFASEQSMRFVPMTTGLTGLKREIANLQNGNPFSESWSYTFVAITTRGRVRQGLR